jgi:predicted molibdopterin-dependent oxidoreductase YjgC
LEISRVPDSFVIVADMFLTETAKLADIIFPLVPFMESDGMVTNAESRIQKFKKVTEPQTGKENWMILNDLGNKFGILFRYNSLEEVSEEINNIVPEYQKPITVFRNGYTPDENLLNAVKYKSIRYGANYLLKWIDQLNQASRNNLVPLETKEEELIN